MDANIVLVTGLHTLEAVRKMDKLRKKSMLCDIILKVGDTQIPAHKIVLASCSPYFEFMFTGELCESEKSEVELKELCPNTLSLLVDYMYSGELLVSETSILAVLQTADFLQIRGAKEKCVEFLQKNMKAKNCLSIKNAARKFCLTELEEKVNNFIILHMEQISMSAEFLKLNEEEVQNFFTDKDINIGYDNSCKALEVWVSFAPDRRTASQTKILNAILGHFKILEQQGCSKYYDVFNKNRIYIFDYKNSNKCHQFDVEKLSLHDIRDRPNLQDFIPVYYKKSIYLISGSDNGLYTDNCPYLDMKTDQWSYKSMPNTQAVNPGACRLGDKIYIIGGSNSRNVSGYDLLTNCLTLEPQLMHIRERPGVTTHGSCIYACGGSTARSVERLDIRMKRWSSIPNTSNDPLGFCSAATLSNRIYCMSMENSISFFEYDIRNGSWLKKSDIPSEGQSKSLHNTLVSTSEALYAVNINGVYTYAVNENVWARIFTYNWSNPSAVSVLANVI